MKKVLLVLATVLSLVSFSALAEVRIATVNTGFLQANAPQYEAMSQRLKSQFSGRQNEIKRLAETINKEQDNLRKNAATMSETQRTNARRNIEQKISDARFKEKSAKEDFEKARRDEVIKLNSQIKKAIDNVAIKGGFNLVIERQAAIFNDVSVPDLTEQVLAELKK